MPPFEHAYMNNLLRSCRVPLHAPVPMHADAMTSWHCLPPQPNLVSTTSSRMRETLVANLWPVLDSGLYCKPRSSLVLAAQKQPFIICLYRFNFHQPGTPHTSIQSILCTLTRRNGTSLPHRISGVNTALHARGSRQTRACHRRMPAAVVAEIGLRVRPCGRGIAGAPA